MKKITLLVICLLWIITKPALAKGSDSEAGGCQAVLILMSQNNLRLSRDQLNFLKKNDERTQRTMKLLNSCPIPKTSEGLPILRSCVEKKMPKNDANYVLEFFSEYNYLQSRFGLRNSRGMLEHESSYIINCLPFQLDARTR